MAQNLILCDEYGIIYEAMKILPNDELKISFLEALAELEGVHPNFAGAKHSGR